MNDTSETKPITLQWKRASQVELETLGFSSRHEKHDYEEWLFGDFACLSHSVEWRRIVAKRDAYINDVEKAGVSLTAWNARNFYAGTKGFPAEYHPKVLAEMVAKRTANERYHRECQDAIARGFDPHL